MFNTNPTSHWIIVDSYWYRSLKFFAVNKKMIAIHILLFRLNQTGGIIHGYSRRKKHKVHIIYITISNHHAYPNS
jgi:hypothetical protein